MLKLSRTTSIWQDSLVVPRYISATSVAILILHIILLSQTFKRVYGCLTPKSRRAVPDASTREHLQGMHPPSFSGQMREHVALHGGTAIFLHKVARFVGCAVLLGVSVATLILEETGQVEDATTGNYLKHGYLKNRIS